MRVSNNDKSPQSKLVTFIKTHVTGNLHIIDHPGLAAAWVRVYVQKCLPPNVLTREIMEAGWLGVATLCTTVLPVRYQNELLENLQALIKRNYPKALEDQQNALCVIMDCREKRAGAHEPACAEHTCQLCKRFIRADWRNTHALLVPGDIYKSYGINVFAHLVPHDMLEQGTREASYFDRVMQQCQAVWQTNHLYMSVICPGSLGPCAASIEGSGYHKDAKCGGAECIPTVLGGIAWDAFKFCEHCWPLNQCQFANSANQHALDPKHPDRRVARVCADENCTLSKQCVACHKWWFVHRFRVGALKLDDVHLCPTCRLDRLCCITCKRLSWKEVPGVFFAPHWIFGGRIIPKGGKEPPVHCVFCLPNVPRIVGEAREEHKQVRIRALLIGWRIRGKTERILFESAFAHDPRAALQAKLGDELTRRERALASSQPDFFWNAMVKDCTLWDSTWWLMFQTARLPRDVFLIILRLVCFTNKQRNATATAAAKSKEGPGTKGTKIKGG